MLNGTTLRYRYTPPHHHNVANTNLLKTKPCQEGRTKRVPLYFVTDHPCWQGWKAESSNPAGKVSCGSYQTVCGVTDIDMWGVQVCLVGLELHTLHMHSLHTLHTNETNEIPDISDQTPL